MIFPIVLCKFFGLKFDSLAYFFNLWEFRVRLVSLNWPSGNIANAIFVKSGL